MKTSAVACVNHLIEEYRRFLRTSYRFLDPHLREQFEAHLAQADVVVKGPYVTLSRDFKLGRTLQQLVETGEAHTDLVRVNWPFGDAGLYVHQEEAFLVGRAGSPFVVTTGTGSGKTEAFLLPVFDGILRRKEEGITGVQAILLYPMNALANDQLERLRRLLRGTRLNISFGLYTGDSDATVQRLREEPAETERLSRDRIRRDPPDVLLTNYKQLEFLLVRKADRALFTPALKYLVLDELHSYRGALATEIACLIRRLKAHAKLDTGQLIAIGTSATVASGAGGAQALADFATSLAGEPFDPAHTIGESVIEAVPSENPWTPAPTDLQDEDLRELNPEDEGAVVALTERLVRRECPPTGAIAERVAAVLEGNAIVEILEKVFREPRSISNAVREVRERLPERGEVPEELVFREVEAYLLVGSVGDDDHPPRLRPKLHTFFHGIYDVSLCLNPECRALVPHGSTECPQCGSAARPAALCRTCGQDFVKVRFQDSDDDHPVGTGDFFSTSLTGYLTPRIHDLPTGERNADEDEIDEADETAAARRREAEAKMERILLCTSCGRILTEGEVCPDCGRPGSEYFLHRGALHTCPACGGVYRQSDIVTPLRTGTASSVSALATHHLDLLEGEDRKLLVFADNRQDVAHQAGYTTDKHRSFALRHIVARLVEEAGEAGVYLTELVERVFDEYYKLGVIPRGAARPERERWRLAIEWELANEFTRHSRRRGSLENLGLVGVEYEYLATLSENPAFREASEEAGLNVDDAIGYVRGMLDILRHRRAVSYSFFREWIYPNRKRKYRELEADPYNVRFPEYDRGPKSFALDRPAHIRSSRGSQVMGFFQENPRQGQLTAPQKLAVRMMNGRETSEAFLRAVVPLLLDPDQPILKDVTETFPIRASERTSGLQILQLNHEIVHLTSPKMGYRCNACRTWRPYKLPTCPNPSCRTGRLIPSPIDRDNYYVQLYTKRAPQRLLVEEHSAQIRGERRAVRETDFKEGRLDALVCTPTLELGVDIGPLLTVVLRNAPPTPANYIQRVGRAGRRLRIGFVSTFCAGGPHDRHAFEQPEWLVAGEFTPPRIRLDNPKIVERHLRSYLLAQLDAELPRLMGEFLDDLREPTDWNRERLRLIAREVRQKTDVLAETLAKLFQADRVSGRATRYNEALCASLVQHFADELSAILEHWWQRVEQLHREYQEYATIGSPRQDQKKASARRRAYYEITQDPDRGYTLNYLSTQGFLPAYQFPVDTFTLDPGVDDTPTLYRPAAIAIQEFAPGNFVYANGHKLESIRVLYAGGPGRTGSEPGRSDAETSGRLRSLFFCNECGEVSVEARNNCPRCGHPLPGAVDTVFVDAFEAEESLRIGSFEESRQKQFQIRRESLLKGDDSCQLYAYPFSPLEYRPLSKILITNWGASDSKTGEGMRFWLCPECGRHQPGNPMDPSSEERIRKWQERHARYCSGQPVPLVLAYQFQADCLVLNLPCADDRTAIGRAEYSPYLVTLAESLLIGARDLLELELREIAAFPRMAPQGDVIDQIVFYETVPGGAGYVEEIAQRLPEVAEAARKRLFGHDCARACYLCLKHYFNQRWHRFFDKALVRDTLLTLSRLDEIAPQEAPCDAGRGLLMQELDARRSEFDQASRTPGTAGPQTPIEERLYEALREIADLPPPTSQHEIWIGNDLLTVPDFAYPDAKIAIFCDGYAFHGDPNTLELDAKKRNHLQQLGWVVLAFWGRTIRRDAAECAREVADVYKRRVRSGGRNSS